MGDTARPTLAELQAQVTAEGTLDLSGYANRPGPLTALPEEIGQLQGLKKLDLGYNPRLRGVLPAALWTLPGLEELDLSGCGLAALPEAVGQLTGLKVLNLYNNFGLCSLPAGLAELEHLTTLDISGKWWSWRWRQRWGPRSGGQIDRPANARRRGQQHGSNHRRRPRGLHHRAVEPHPAPRHRYMAG